MKVNLNGLLDLPREHFYVTLQGKLVDDWNSLKEENNFQVHVRVLGGKGGFGSLLRSFGSQFYKSSNQDMCRDLSGRRLKDVKEEAKLKKYISKAAQREEEKQQKLDEKYKKLKRLDEKKHEFNDPEYSRQKERILEETKDALQEGLKALEEGLDSPTDDAGPSTSHSIPILKRKRDDNSDSNESAKASDVEPKTKKPKKAVAGDLWLGIDGINESDLEDSDSDPDDVAPETSFVKQEIKIKLN